MIEQKQLIIGEVTPHKTNKMRVKMRSLQAEYRVLCRYFGEEFMEAMFRNYKGYKEVRINSTYQEVYNEIDSII